jgi:nicotinate-nucleotide adenylyltransferase
MRQPQPEVVFGGTFDPVHKGHLAIARALVQQLKVTVRFVPVFKPGHRQPCEVSPDHRMAMLTLALEGEEGMLIDAYEFSLGETVPTSQLLRHLRSQLSSVTPLFFVLGEDAFVDLPNWVESDQILEMANLIVIPRKIEKIEESILSEIPYLTAIEDNMVPSGRVFQLSFPKVETSATSIRAQLAAGGRSSALPQSVGDYIERQGLYRILEKTECVTFES